MVLAAVAEKRRSALIGGELPSAFDGASGHRGRSGFGVASAERVALAQSAPTWKASSRAIRSRSSALDVDEPRCDDRPAALRLDARPPRWLWRPEDVRWWW